MVMDIIGEHRQLPPEEQQVVGTEIQEPRVPDSVLPRIEEEEKREIPLPVAPRPALPPAEQLAAQEAQQVIFGIPIVRLDRYNGGDQDWKELVRWDIPLGRTGDLHEISLLSDNDAVTRYRIVIGNIDQNIPTDRQSSTPLDLKWQRSVIPGGTAVFVQVMSNTGATITVYGSITGTER